MLASGENGTKCEYLTFFLAIPEGFNFHYQQITNVPTSASKCREQHLKRKATGSPPKASGLRNMDSEKLQTSRPSTNGRHNSNKQINMIETQNKIKAIGSFASHFKLLCLSLSFFHPNDQVHVSASSSYPSLIRLPLDITQAWKSQTQCLSISGNKWMCLVSCIGYHNIN
jgi:hypothetical protein